MTAFAGVTKVPQLSPPHHFQLGIIPQPITFQDPNFGLVSGIEVWNIIGGQPAQQAGIDIGDIITRVNGTPVQSLLDLTNALNASGGTVVLRVRDVNSGQYTDTGPISLLPAPPGTGGVGAGGVGP